LRMTYASRRSGVLHILASVACAPGLKIVTTSPGAMAQGTEESKSLAELCGPDRSLKKVGLHAAYDRPLRQTSPTRNFDGQIPACPPRSRETDSEIGGPVPHPARSASRSRR